MVGIWKLFPRILLSLALLLFVSSANASATAEVFTFIKKQTLEYASRYYLDGKAQLSPSQRRDIECLSKAMFFEARGESYKGKKFVANVIQNRVKYGRPFKNDICSVVYQKHQFSWTSSKWKRDISFKQIVNRFKNERRQQEEIAKIALEIVILKEEPLTNSVFFSTGGFKFGGIKLETKIGNHNFYSFQ